MRSFGISRLLVTLSWTFACATASQALLRFSNQILGPNGSEPQMFGRIEHLVRNVAVFEVSYREASDAIEALAASS